MPSQPPELSLLAKTSAKQQRFADAEVLLHRALALTPNDAEALFALSKVLTHRGRLDEALAILNRALRIKPKAAEILFDRGLVWYRLGRLDKALGDFDRALAVKPDYPNALNARAIVLRGLRRLDEALTSFDQALAIRPNWPEVLCNRGVVLRELKRSEEALKSYDEALEIDPGHADALSNRGNILCELGRLEEALADQDEALSVRSNFPEAHLGRGITLRALLRLDDALESFDKTVAIRPGFADAHYFRGLTLRELSRWDEALASFEMALSADPQHLGALYNRGILLFELQRPKDALVSFRKSIAISPDFPGAYANEAVCLLQLGEYVEGWRSYEWRWRCEEMSEYRREFSKPQWRGQEDLSGRTVLLHAEQGFGDTIQFCRYSRSVAARGARVLLQVQPPLKSLLSRLDGTQQVLALGEPLPEFDLHCPLLSLPLALRTTLSSIPAATPYLKADPALLESWEAILESTPRPRIGLVWSGTPTHKNDRNRSVALDRLIPLLGVKGTLMSLQKELRPGDATLLKQHGVLHFGDDLRDFDDTAALLTSLDLLISVDTATAHLAGALSKPVWLMLTCLGPDWRWMLDRADSPWYPTATLFRQPKIDDWESVIEVLLRRLDTKTVNSS